MPVVVNLLNSRGRFARAFGIPQEALHDFAARERRFGGLKG